MVRVRISLKSWNTTPSLRRSRGISFSGMAARRCPASWISPLLGVCSRKSSFSRVDFPAPLGPVRNTNSPDSMAKLTSARAVWIRSYCLPTWVRVIMGPCAFGLSAISERWVEPAFRLTAESRQLIALSNPLHQHGHALAAADAEGGEAEALVLVLEEVQEGDEDAGAAGAHGVADGDGAAAQVHLGGIKLGQLGQHAQALGGEGFVQLEEVDVLQLHAGLGQQLLDGGHGAQAHGGGVHTSLGEAEDAGDGLVGLGGGLGGPHQGPGAIVDAAGVAGGHGAVLLEGGLELREPLGGGVGLDVLVAVEEHVALLARQGDGEHLAVEGACGLGRGGLLLALEGEG